jgi:hypothetical protein
MKRVVTKYAKVEPYEQVEEFEVFANVIEFRHLFEYDDDVDMICCYKLKNKEQIDFFRNLGVPVDPQEGFWFVECYSD